jgi:hypothetical protein
MRVLLNNQPQTVLSETVTSITFAVSTGLTPGWYNLSVSNVNSSAAALARAVAVISSAQGDDDGDGLPNGWEIEHGLDPFDNGAIDPRNGAPGDPDGDGATNSQEYSAGTDPRDRNSVFKITGVSLSGVEIVTISWSSAAGRRYSVDRAAQLSGPFVRLTKGVAATPPVTSFSDSNAAPPGPWFYRVVVE